MDQQQMDAIRDIIIEALKGNASRGEEGNEVYAEIDGEDVVLIVEPV